MRHRQWTPAALPTRDVIFLGTAFLAQVVVRGIDYMRGVGEEAPEYAYLTAAYPIEFVGLALLAAAATGLVGMAIRCHVMVWIGHSAVALMYAIIAATMLVSIVADPRMRWDKYGSGGIAGLTGYLFLVAAGTLAVGTILRRFQNRISTTLAVTVIGMVIGAVVVIEAPVRAPGIFVVAALAHGVIALRTGPSPLAIDEHPGSEEEIVEPAGGDGAA